jgi:hypothetical protein
MICSASTTQMLLPFLAAGVHIAGVLDGHLGIGGVQAAHVLVLQAAFALDEDLPEGPVVGIVRSLVFRCVESTVGRRSVRVRIDSTT